MITTNKNSYSQGWLGKYDLRVGGDTQVHGRHTYSSRDGRAALWFSPLIGLWCVGHTAHMGTSHGQLFVAATGRGWLSPERAPGLWSFFREDTLRWELVPHVQLSSDLSS